MKPTQTLAHLGLKSGSKKARALAGALTLIVALGVRTAFAETLFSNEGKADVRSEPRATLHFTLLQPTIITTLRTYHWNNGEGAPAGVARLFKDGRLVFKAQANVAAKAYWVVEPGLVFPAGAYTLSLSPSSTWSWSDPSGGQGMVTVTGDAVPPPDRAKVAEYFTSISTQPATLADIQGARLEASRLRQNVKEQTAGLAHAPERKGALADLQRQLADRKATENDGDSERKKPLSGVVDGNATTARYADTVAGERLNRRQGSDTRNFGGSRQGRVSNDEDDADLNTTLQDMLRDAGGKVTGDPQKDAAEAAYMMSVGTEGWTATKDLSESERLSYWRRQAFVQGGSPRVRPAEDTTYAGSFQLFGTPAMRDAQRRFLDRAISARLNAAGGKAAEKSGGTMKPQQGQDDAPARERSSGTINWDRVFEINAKINPTRR